MKKKLLGIFVCMLLITTALPAVGTMNDGKETPVGFKLGGNSLNHQSAPNNIMSWSRGGMFIQLPYLANATPEQWGAPWSNEAFNCKAYGDFFNVPEPICDIHWWGLSGWWNQSLAPPEGMLFNITFYQDDGTGKPGTMVNHYEDIEPTWYKTGIIYYYEPSDLHNPLYYFTDVELDPCCELSSGWVSIQSTYSDNGAGFAWEPSPDGNGIGWQQYYNTWFEVNDFAYVLTDGVPADPDLECDGELSWTDVKPGDTVTGDFVVRNNGDPDSILHWKVESYPNWGSNWTFTPNASVLTIGAGWITVDVEVISPDDPNEEFTGEVKLVNVMDSSDSCTIDVSLATPRNRAFNINLLFLRFLENHPHLFPILRHLLGL